MDAVQVEMKNNLKFAAVEESEYTPNKKDGSASF
jgi:hypothetical protein